MKRSLFVFVLFALIAVVPTHAQTVLTGNELLTQCREKNTFSEGHCLGFINGFIYGFENGATLQAGLAKTTPSDAAKLYIPDRATVGQLRDVVVK
jgi:hypothetical protein